jgi:protein involved in polysaccharide export with SLBB domain
VILRPKCPKISAAAWARRASCRSSRCAADVPIGWRIWNAPERTGRVLASLPRRVTSTWILAFAVLGVGLTACESTRSYERSSDGSTVYIDQLSEPEKADARRKIEQSLRLGPRTYDVGIGDEIEILFFANRSGSLRRYVLAVDDQIRIEFLNDPDIARTVKLAPDGQIFLPLIGPVMAAGQTPEALARKLQQLYSGHLAQPQITVNVTESHSRQQDFLDAIAPSSKGRSLVNRVLPDGTISLPKLRPLRAQGRTLQAIEGEIDAAYSELGLDITVSAVPRTLRVGTTYVLGEVAKPGRIELERSQTVLMAVAQAGGILVSGAMTSVRVFYFAENGMARVRSINLKRVLEDLRLEEDMIVPVNSIIYVPPTDLAKAGRFMDAVVRDILRFGGFTFGSNYILNSGMSNSTSSASTTAGAR